METSKRWFCLNTNKNNNKTVHPKLILILFNVKFVIGACDTQNKVLAEDKQPYCFRAKSSTIPLQHQAAVCRTRPVSQPRNAPRPPASHPPQSPLLRCRERKQLKWKWHHFYSITDTLYLCVAGNVLEQETSTLSWGYNTISAFFKQEQAKAMARRKTRSPELCLLFTCCSLFWTWAGLSNLSGWQIENKAVGRHNGGRKIDKGTIQTYGAPSMEPNVLNCTVPRKRTNFINVSTTKGSPYALDKWVQN